MKVALVHYWLTGMRGGEKVLEALCELYPDADIFTLVADEEQLSPTLRRHKITTSFLQKIGGVKHYRKMLGLMPFALESFDLTEYDLVISSEAGPAKGIVPRPDAVHVCYCHSPMRYVWDLYPQYHNNAGPLSRLMMQIFSPLVRQWDVTTSSRVDGFIANSAFVAKRIRKYYRRGAMVVNPPIDLSRFAPAGNHGDFYLCAGQITPYKKIELAIEAFSQLGLPLQIVGSGATEAMRRMAGPTIQFLGPVDDATMAEKFAKCKALIFPGLEDFGMVPLEVMASGRPVIAFGKGGALETVVDGVTGTFFYEQTTAALSEAVLRFEEHGVRGTPEDFQAHVTSFDRDEFKRKISVAIQAIIDREKSAGPEAQPET